MYFLILPVHAKRLLLAISYSLCSVAGEGRSFVRESRYRKGGLENICLISISLGSKREKTHEMRSASIDPAPKNLVYAEIYPRCGAGSQLTFFLPFASGSHG
jgi:hypothetical protein